MSKSEAPTAKRVTSDWMSTLPGFAAWRPLRLLRRIGPVVQGVTLDRTTSGDGYFPTVHIHALVREFPVVTLTLGQRLITPSGVQESIPFALHSTEFGSAAQRLIAQSELSLEEPPSISEIVNSLYEYVAVQQDKGLPPAVRELEDGILVAAAVGERSLVERGLDLARQMANVWPKSRLPLDWQGSDVWLTGLEQRVDDSSGLQDVVERQVAFHKLAKVPDAQ
ncbi:MULTISPECIES: hypothetical protein [Streptomyces]|uniref:Uncharacterized protein n=1 Tax=Streptomyces sviceus (strain ATCC 29083 / DSM 924 / JCM 4929 / NBRC 13980 / NCIMB 11184 / NRRL 5439 / UC 5370) TaxID=463191 RepID=B5HWY8_STRX2|nr:MULTISPECIES: hypothetical protein [Streptomyces]EDY57343.1 conserved hypothetical protein [Streptomyces sviceus ATCC 29083]MYT06359.1 hypothetical protein [Streptomyces sp. SID5470]